MLIGSTARSGGVYMTKAVRGLMRQVSTSEVNTLHIKQGKTKWVSSKQSEAEWFHLHWETGGGSPGFSLKVFVWGNMCALCDESLMCIMKMNWPEMLSLSLWSHFITRDVVAKPRSQRWQKVMFHSRQCRLSPANTNIINNSIFSLHQKYLSP